VFGAGSASLLTRCCGICRLWWQVSAWLSSSSDAAKDADLFVLIVVPAIRDQMQHAMMTGEEELMADLRDAIAKRVDDTDSDYLKSRGENAADAVLALLRERGTEIRHGMTVSWHHDGILYLFDFGGG